MLVLTDSLIGSERQMTDVCGGTVSAADEVAGLDKVLSRLAVTEEDKLEKVSA